MSEILRIRDLGRCPYASGLEAQRAAHARVLEARSRGGAAGELLLVEHDPAVITLGRRREAASHVIAPPAHLAALGIEVVQTDRGGDATWHGPGQLVAYPILDLDRLGLRIHPYMRWLEQCVIDALGVFGLQGHRDAEATGVWVAAADEAGATASPSARKICAMGVRVSRWVSLHGLALNVAPDLRQFDLIVPCGLHGRPVTSLRAELGERAPSMEAVKRVLGETIERAVRARMAAPALGGRVDGGPSAPDDADPLNRR